MPISIEEDVSVMPIFNLEKVCDDGVAYVLLLDPSRKLSGDDAPASERMKFRWALANFAEDISPYD